MHAHTSSTYQAACTVHVHWDYDYKHSSTLASEEFAQVVESPRVMLKDSIKVRVRVGVME